LVAQLTAATPRTRLGDTFDQSDSDTAVGQHPAIPRSNKDLIAIPISQAAFLFTRRHRQPAGCHFAFIEQGGNVFTFSSAQSVSNRRRCCALLLFHGSVGKRDFPTWHDKAGKALGWTEPIPVPRLYRCHGPFSPTSMDSPILKSPRNSRPTSSCGAPIVLNRQFGTVVLDHRPTETRMRRWATARPYRNGRACSLGHTSKDGTFLDGSSTVY